MINCPCMQRRKLLGCALGLSTLAWAKNKKFTLPAPNPASSVANGAKVIPRPAGAQLKLPVGFVAEEFATGFQKPRIMLELPGGTVLVTESLPKGSVVAVVGAGNPKPGPKPLITGLDRPFGMALWKEYLYVAEAESVKRYKLDAKALTVGAGEEVVLHLQQAEDVGIQRLDGGDELFGLAGELGGAVGTTRLKSSL